MPDLRTDLERLGGRATPTPDAFERLDRRRRRRERNRRIGAGVLAFALVAGGSLVAFSAFRGGDGQTLAGGGSDGFFALWPEQTATGLAAAQDAVDAGDPDAAWRADPAEVVRRFATERLLWPEVTVSLQDGSDPETDEILFYDLRYVGHSCPFGADAEACGSAAVSVVLERLGRPDGLWSVTEVHGEGLSLPLVTGDEVAAGTTISIPTSLRDGEEVSVGVAFLAACDATGIDENVVAQDGTLAFQVPAVPDGCTGYVYAMRPKTEPGAVAIGSFLFTDAPARPDIGYFVEAISAIPVRFANDAPAEVAEFTCDDTGTISPSTLAVAAQPDGVHVRIVNAGSQVVSFSIAESSGGSLESGGTAETTYALAPGPVTVACSVVQEGGTGAAGSAIMTVTDPNGYFVPAELECANGQAYGTASSYAEGATGVAGDPIQVVRDHVSGLEPEDLVEPAGYPESPEPVVRILRAGAVVGRVTLFDDGQGGWLASAIEGCDGTRFGWSEQPTGITGPPADAGVVCIEAGVLNDPGAHMGTDLRVKGESVRFDTGCLSVPAGERFTITFTNLDEGIPRNISLYPMQRCLADAIAAETPPTCDLGEPVFRGELVTGVGEIVYELGPLEAGGYYFQDDVHPQANGALIAR